MPSLPFPSPLLHSALQRSHCRPRCPIRTSVRGKMMRRIPDFQSWLNLFKALSTRRDWWASRQNCPASHVAHSSCSILATMQASEDVLEDASYHKPCTAMQILPTDERPSPASHGTCPLTLGSWLVELWGGRTLGSKRLDP